MVANVLIRAGTVISNLVRDEGNTLLFNAERISINGLDFGH